MWSALTIGAVATALSIWMLVRKKAAKTSIWLAAIGGLTVGVGLLGVWAQRIGSWATQAGNRGTVLLFGAVVPAVLAVIVLAELFHAAHPKKGKPSQKVHVPVAFLAPAVLLAAGGIFAGAVGFLHHPHLPPPPAVTPTTTR
jgi:hypothetical protein